MNTLSTSSTLRAAVARHRATLGAAHSPATWRRRVGRAGCWAFQLRRRAAWRTTGSVERPRLRKGPLFGRTLAELTGTATSGAGSAVVGAVGPWRHPGDETSARRQTPQGSDEAPELARRRRVLPSSLPGVREGSDDGGDRSAPGLTVARSRPLRAAGDLLRRFAGGGQGTTQPASPRRRRLVEAPRWSRVALPEAVTAGQRRTWLRRLTRRALRPTQWTRRPWGPHGAARLRWDGGDPSAAPTPWSRPLWSEPTVEMADGALAAFSAEPLGQARAASGLPVDGAGRHRAEAGSAGGGDDRKSRTTAQRRDSEERQDRGDGPRKPAGRAGKSSMPDDPASRADEVPRLPQQVSRSQLEAWAIPSRSTGGGEDLGLVARPGKPTKPGLDAKPPAQALGEAPEISGRASTQRRHGSAASQGSRSRRGQEPPPRSARVPGPLWVPETLGPSDDGAGQSIDGVGRSLDGTEESRELPDPSMSDLAPTVGGSTEPAPTESTRDDLWLGLDWNRATDRPAPSTSFGSTTAPESDLAELETKLERILAEQARRHGIDV